MPRRGRPAPNPTVQLTGCCRCAPPMPSPASTPRCRSRRAGSRPAPRQRRAQAGAWTAAGTQPPRSSPARRRPSMCITSRQHSTCHVRLRKCTSTHARSTSDWAWWTDPSTNRPQWTVRPSRWPVPEPRPRPAPLSVALAVVRPCAGHFAASSMVLVRRLLAWLAVVLAASVFAAPADAAAAPALHLYVYPYDDYLTMRCGPQPRDPRCVSDRQRLDNWWAAEQQATGGFVADRIAWVFGQGGGGFAGSNLIGDWAGFALLGDWTLEPISGVAEPSAIPCVYATWQCQGGAPKGAAAHELGHTFGLHHPDCYANASLSLMGWHGDFPNDILFPWEINNLRNNPYLRHNAWRPSGPWLDFGNADFMYWGETQYLFGRDFLAGDTVEFTDATHSVFVAADVVATSEIRVDIPRDIGPGFIRIVRSTDNSRSNIVPVNFYENRFGPGCPPLP